MVRWFGTRLDREVKVLVADVEEQSVLVCQTGAPSKRPSHERIQKGFATMHEWYISVGDFRTGEQPGTKKHEAIDNSTIE